MSYKIVLPQTILLIVATLFIAGCSAAAPTPPTKTTIQPTITPTPTSISKSPFRILFIGNRMIVDHGGVYFHLDQLVDSSSLPYDIEAESVHRFWASLKIMWDATNAPEAIREGNYDVVVLQGDLSQTDVETFHDSTRKFVTEIETVGAEPVLFMLWPPGKDGEWPPMDEISKAHFDIAAELGVDVAPIGLAWQRAMKERPELDLYSSAHPFPSIYGTYLAANVVYATVFRESPIGLAYRPEGYFALSNGGYALEVAEEDAAFLQRIAWEAVQEYQAQQ